jgi:hypothetical protein
MTLIVRMDQKTGCRDIELDLRLERQFQAVTEQVIYAVDYFHIRLEHTASFSPGSIRKVNVAVSGASHGFLSSGDCNANVLKCPALSK